MATKILVDIQNDVKLLITAITGFEEGEEGFRVCESFALSNVKHHRYLSVNGKATERSIDDLVKKFSIHGKYEVSKKFKELVDVFLSSFDFAKHPQYDLQWSLLSFVLNLSNETNNSEIKSLETPRNLTNDPNCSNVSDTRNNENKKTEDIDWASYLREGMDNFFNDFNSDSDSDWSDDESEASQPPKKTYDDQTSKELLSLVPMKIKQSTSDKISKILSDGVESRNWLKQNVQNGWWNRIDSNKYPVDSGFPLHANFCNLWDQNTTNEIQRTATLSEYQVCREILRMFHCPVEMVLFQENEGNEFTIREDVSIPSLTSDAFTNVLKPLCDHFKILRELELFGESLYQKSNCGEAGRPPLTYETYYGVLSQRLNKLKEELVEIEMRFIKQDGFNTLLSLMNDLGIHLKTIKILHEIHQSVITDWKFESNWKCASKLLSGLFFESQNSSCCTKSNIALSLYVRSLSVYLNIIDTWLSEGRLEDWREEFIIAKIPEDFSIEDEEQRNKFIVRELDSICLGDPIMQLLVYKVREMGRNIELLVSLDRILDMWKMVNDRSVCRISLNDEFLVKAMTEFGKYNPRESIKSVEVSMIYNGIQIPGLDAVDSTMEQNVFQQMPNSDDPFLLKPYEDYGPFDISVDDVVDGDVKDSGINLDVFERLQSISDSILPSRRVLENVLSKILDSRYKGASKLVRNIMVSEYNLETHLKLMRCVYMMETGHIMNKFYELLFTEIESNPTWNNPNTLTNILEEILSQEWSDSSSRWSILVDVIHTRQVLPAVEKITLHYAIGWPICMVLSKDSLVKYNQIFRFQLKLKWALWTLDHLRFSDLEGIKAARINNRLELFQTRRLESLRFWLIHAIGSIHSYLSGQVLQSLGFMLEKALAEADNLDTIIRVHNEYLVKVHEHCLQTLEFEDLTTTINNLLEMCINVRDLWNRGSENVSSSDLDTMESSYIKYHTYLALALHNAVQHKDADYYKLTPQFQSCESEDGESGTSEDEEINIIEDKFSELSKNLLTEVAYQSLPPSGFTVPIPKLFTIEENNKESKNRGLAIQLRKQLAAIEYERNFSHLRWYRYEERLGINDLRYGADSICDQLDRFVEEFEGEEETFISDRS